MLFPSPAWLWANPVAPDLAGASGFPSRSGYRWNLWSICDPSKSTRCLAGCRILSRTSAAPHKVGPVPTSTIDSRDDSGG